MKARVGLQGCTVAAFALAVSTAAATATAQHRTEYTYVGPPEHLSTGDQYYDPDLSGLRKYVNTLRADDPALFRRLDPEVSGLETRQNAAVGSVVGGMIILASGLAYGFVGSMSCDSSTTDCSKPLKLGAGIGLAGGVLGVFAFLGLHPSHDDLLDVINLHNRLNPERPLEFKLGLDARHKTFSARVELRFDPSL